MNETLIETSWHSYPSIFNLGHKALQPLFDGPVVIQEKIDGSQLSFGVFGGEVKIRSKGRVFPIDAPDGLFERAAESVQGIAHRLKDGWTYRGEYLAKPKHNTLKYNRVPKGHIILFDINNGHESYLDPSQLAIEAEEVGLESVPLLFTGHLKHSTESLDMVRSMIDAESCLGGVKMEGLVIKNYAQFGSDKKALMGKHVSEAFKEIHQRGWKASNPKGGDIVQALIEDHRTEARWQKAVQHLRESGQLTGTPQDIGVLIKEAQRDIKKEQSDYIKQKLYEWAVDKITRGAVSGLPEWYKEQLLAQQFEEQP